MIDKVHIIHLPHRSDRASNIRIQFANIPHKLWDGIIHPTEPYAGIAAAHKQIIQYAYLKGLEYVCIAEDDCCFTAPGAWEHYIGNIPEDFDLYLSSIYHGVIKEDNTVEDFCGLTLYLVHSRFYKSFLSIPQRGNLDRLLADVNGRYVVCDPFTTYQMNGFSDNKQRYASYEHLMVNRNVFK